MENEKKFPKKFKYKERVYYMCGNCIHSGTIKAKFELPPISMKYLIQTNGGTIWMLDHKLFHSVDELVEDLKSLIVD